MAALPFGKLTKDSTDEDKVKVVCMTVALDLLGDTDWNFPKSSKADSIHSIHPYPAKFIPELPRHLIAALGVPKGTIVLDPFCGSGVTLVEAQRAGFESMGIDLNPIACLISEVKTQPVPEGLLEQAQAIVDLVSSNQKKTTIPAIPNLSHWFKLHIQEVVTQFVVTIDSTSTGHANRALKMALSSILVRVSNQDSDTRYAAVEKAVTTEDVSRYFMGAVKKIWATRQPELYPLPNSIVLNKNILSVAQNSDIKKPVGLVVTSPPYPNAYEYWLYHKYRMYWLGFDPQKVKNEEIGARAHYFKKNHATVEDFVAQMSSVFTMLKSVVVKRGRICFVIGRSKIHGQIVDNAELLVDVARGLNIKLVAVTERQIAPSRKSFNLSHANIKTEHILVFEV